MGMRVGLPGMSEHPGERRDFLPRLVLCLTSLGADEVLIEEGYGSRMGLEIADYEGDRVRVAPAAECLAQDVVVVLRCPGPDRLQHLQPGSVLVSMLHYPTRLERTAWLRKSGIRAVSLDSVTDDGGRRMVENLELTAWVGVAEAFAQLARGWPEFAMQGRRPIRATVLGTGALGIHAVHAAVRYGDHETRDALERSGVPGVEVAAVDRDLTWHEDYMLQRLGATDLLIDATRRLDPTVSVIPNRWLGMLPDHAVVLDLAADPYDLRSSPPAVKAIEGSPHGSLEHYLFAPDDPAWDACGDAVDTSQRRTAVSCDAWPGLRPRESMRRYGEQLEEILEVVLAGDPDRWSRRSGNHRERSVARAELEGWIKHRHA